VNTADSNPSKSEIDRLGDRLRVSDTPDDRQMLDMYCRTFVKAYEIVLRQIYVTHGFNKVGRRRAKSHGAIVDKLKWESIRLSQMQDIAGCRIVVPDVAHQNALLEKLRVSFSEVEISDRREKPSHGYCAVHLLVQIENRCVEIQIRTQLQALWAELSEKLVYKFGIAIKYGGGVAGVQHQLKSLSKAIHVMEMIEPVINDPVTQWLHEDTKTVIRNELLKLREAAEIENDFSD
jgi:putative GTP pyrophosphokinase